ncbi:PTS lactose/cellobiose transporter subunit IIA [Lacticaseibacillus paracasei]|uniref:PTS lactose/cellobiose transporter subunit IIA n=1 Tax=Lacticaseibacillus paracasei TaxID=1597 RepID=UPI0033936286
MDDAMTHVVMGLIMQGGNAKGYAVAAIRAAQDGDFKKSQEQFKLADDALNKAHDIQTKLLAKEARGEHTEVNLYLVHAQDWLMNGITFIDLAREIVALYRKISL